VAIQLKSGMRLRSQTDTTEIVVVRAPAVPVDLRGGGRPFVALTDEVAPQSIEAGFAGGTLLGKRYADGDLGLELLCTKPGQGSISVGTTVLQIKSTKALPASD
jgi:hypothetical protein